MRGLLARLGIGQFREQFGNGTGVSGVGWLVIVGAMTVTILLWSGYLGPLSRFEQGADSAKDIDIAFVLSGPEPQRSVFQGLIEGAFADQPSL